MQRKMQHALFFIGGLVFVCSVSRAQGSLDLPRASQQGKVMQRIGLTEITINYSRPLVNGRKIWGGLEPYGNVWRAGANENTTIDFSDPVRVEGKPLAKGTYGLHMIPGEKEWTVIFSKNHTSWGSYTYDLAEDALRVAVTPQPGEFHEALTYDFANLKPDSTTVTLRWEKLSVPFKVDVNVSEIVQQSLKNQLRGAAKWTWQGWDEAANYLLANKLSLQDALKYADASIVVEERFDNLITKANVLDALSRKDDAVSIRKKALILANAVQLHGYGRQLQIEGKQQEAFDVFRSNIKKNPNHWVVHNEAARLACAQGNFDGAVKEMKLAMAGAPVQYKSLLEPLVKRLEAKQDINK